MKTALDCYGRGKQKESSADEYIVNSYYSRERFICPECGEFVHLRRSKYSNYFAHYKKQDTSAECDRRVDGVPTDSIYERIGLPLYIRHGVAKETYELYMGFKALPQSIMEIAEKNKIRLSIDGKATYIVNQERFSVDGTVLVPIHHIPRYEQKYIVSYSPVDKACLLIKHWSDYADGFSYSGGFFSISGQGGRKIRHGDSISTDVEYYWVKKDKYLPNLPGLITLGSGKLVLDDSTWFVNRVFISSDVSDIAFERTATYIRENLQLYLLEKEPKYIPIWPPLIKQEDEYIVEQNRKKIYGSVMSGNENPKTYIYKGVISVPTEVEYKNKLLAIDVDSNDFLINIDRKYVSGGTRFRLDKHEFETLEPQLYIQSGSDNVEIESQSIEIDYIPECILGIENKVFILINSKGDIQVTDNSKGIFDFKCLSSGDTLYILSATYLKTIIKIKNNEEKKCSYSNEELLLKQIQLFKNHEKAFLPSRLKMQLINVSWKNKKLQDYFSDCIQRNVISVPLIRFLEGMLNERN